MKARSLILGALLATLAAPAMAQELVDATQVEAILGIARAHGEATLEAQADGDPRIAGTIGTLPYQVFFMNCTANVACEDINFYAGFANTKPTLDAINAWNREKRFGNAYLDSALDAVMEYDVNLEYGVSRDNLDAAFVVWALLIEQFAAHIGYTPATPLP